VVVSGVSCEQPRSGVQLIVDSLRRVFRRLAALVLVAAPLPALPSSAREEIRWKDVDQLCGRLQLEAPEKKTIVVDGKSESRLYTAYLRDAITLYSAKKAEQECCSASPIATARSRKFGTFELRAAQPG
jgi:hypothetical protein